MFFSLSGIVVDSFNFDYFECSDNYRKLSLLFTISLFSVYLFIVRQSDEVGGQNGKHVCLDECHE